MMDGFINLLKPPGLSSGTGVTIVKRLTGARVGHAGTLDPEAAGVLPVMVGRATRLFDFLVDKSKTYLAEVAFGCATDTQDAQGVVTSVGDDYPSAGDIRRALPRFIGDIAQRPPAYSALKVGGVPLYKLARRGAAPQADARRIRVESIDYLGETENHGCMLRIVCGRGTYIRTLCNDLGEALGCPAHMRFLLREQTGVFDLQTAVTIEQLKVCKYQTELQQYLLPLDYPLGHLPRIDAPQELAHACRNGARLSIGHMLPAHNPPVEESACARVYIKERFAGIWQRNGDAFAPRFVLAEGE